MIFMHQRRNSYLKCILLGIFTSLLTTACGHQTNGQEPYPGSGTAVESCQTITHDLGDTEVCSEPQTIVVIGTNMLELLLALEVQPNGYADYFALPNAVFDNPSQQIPYLGQYITSQPSNIGTWGNPSLEAIAKLQPDLILSSGNENGYELLSQIAPTLVFNYTAEERWQEHLKAIAAAIDLTDQAEQVIANHNQRLTAAKESLQSIAADSPKVLLLASDGLGNNLQIEGSVSRCGSLLQTLGFQLVYPADFEQGGSTMSLEILPQLEADWILVTAWNTDFKNREEQPLAEHQIAPVKQQWQENPIAQSLEASKAGRVYFSSTYLCRGLPGPIGTELILEDLRQSLLNP